MHSKLAAMDTLLCALCFEGNLEATSCIKEWRGGGPVAHFAIPSYLAIDESVYLHVDIFGKSHIQFPIPVFGPVIWLVKTLYSEIHEYIFYCIHI